jgi:hypothetical protein
MRGEARDTGIELRTGEAAFAGEVDNRHLVRRPVAEMGDPVVIAYRQESLHFQRSCAARLQDFTPCRSSWRPYRDSVLCRVAGLGPIGRFGGGGRGSAAPPQLAYPTSRVMTGAVHTQSSSPGPVKPGDDSWGMRRLRAQQILRTRLSNTTSRSRGPRVLLSNFLTLRSEGAGNAGRRSTRSRPASVTSRAAPLSGTGRREF